MKHLIKKLAGTVSNTPKKSGKGKRKVTEKASKISNDNENNSVKKSMDQMNKIAKSEKKLIVKKSEKNTKPLMSTGITIRKTKVKGKDGKYDSMMVYVTKKISVPKLKEFVKILKIKDLAE